MFHKERERLCSWNRGNRGVRGLEIGEIWGEKVVGDGLHMALETKILDLISKITSHRKRFESLEQGSDVW